MSEKGGFLKRNLAKKSQSKVKLIAVDNKFNSNILDLSYFFYTTDWFKKYCAL